MPGAWSWRQRLWDVHGFKHHWEHPPPAGLTWADIVVRTGQFINNRRPTAKYHPRIKREHWRLLERATLKYDKATRRYLHEFDSDREEVRTFCRLVTGLSYPLGASAGQETNWIYVEWYSSPQGEYHGRPITEAELKRLGANL